MTIIAFPTERELLERRVRELGGVVIWRSQQPAKLTAREADVLALLGRRERSSLSIAAELVLDRRWVQKILSNLDAKGYACREGKHRGGGWIRVPEALREAA